MVGQVDRQRRVAAVGHGVQAEDEADARLVAEADNLGPARRVEAEGRVRAPPGALARRQVVDDVVALAAAHAQRRGRQEARGGVQHGVVEVDLHDAQVLPLGRLLVVLVPVEVERDVASRRARQDARRVHADLGGDGRRWLREHAGRARHREEEEGGTWLAVRESGASVAGAAVVVGMSTRRRQTMFALATVLYFACAAPRCASPAPLPEWLTCAAPRSRARGAGTPA